MLRFVGLIVFSFSLCSCASMLRSTSPESAEVVLLRAKQLEVEPQKLSSSKSERSRLRPGQWVATLHRSNNDINDVTLQILKVVDIKGDVVTLESETYASSADGKRQVIQQQLANYPVNLRTAYSNTQTPAAIENIEVRSIKMQDGDGEIVSLPQIPMGLGKLGASMVNKTVSSGSIEKSPCASNLIESPQCYVIPFEVSVLFQKISGTTYGHSDVPIVGFIKSEDNTGTTEVIGYGQSGAEVIIR